MLVGCDGGALDRVRNARRHIRADTEQPLRIGEVLRGIGKTTKRLSEAVADRLRVRRDLARLGRCGEPAVDVVACRPVENLALSAVERLALRLLVSGVSLGHGLLPPGGIDGLALSEFRLGGLLLLGRHVFPTALVEAADDSHAEIVTR